MYIYMNAYLKSKHKICDIKRPIVQSRMVIDRMLCISNDKVEQSSTILKDLSKEGFKRARNKQRIISQGKEDLFIRSRLSRAVHGAVDLWLRSGHFLHIRFTPARTPARTPAHCAKALANNHAGRTQEERALNERICV